MSGDSKRASTLAVPVAELLRSPGAHRALSLQADLAGLSTTDAEVLGPVHLGIRLESSLGGIEASGTLAARWRGSCRRCLAPIEQAVRQEFREMFSVSPTDEETYPICNSEVDLSPMVRDCLVLALPLAPLCSQDCAGPAPDSYPVDNTGIAAGERLKDSRWAALDALRITR